MATHRRTGVKRQTALPPRRLPAVSCLLRSGHGETPEKWAGARSELYPGRTTGAEGSLALCTTGPFFRAP